MKVEINRGVVRRDTNPAYEVLGFPLDSRAAAPAFTRVSVVLHAFKGVQG